jgi:hypothetical protein
VILLLQLFERVFEYYLATYLIEIYTYFLFCYTFTIIYARVKQHQRIDLIKKYLFWEFRVSNIIFAVVTLFVFVLTIVVFSTTLSANCDEVYKITFYLLFGFEIILYALTLWFGILILAEMRKQGM